MKRWFISDTHFCHSNVIKYENRPFSCAQDMNEKIIENWNSVVSSYDHVFHLGDFGFAPLDVLVRILGSLAGRKTLVLGNHDGSATKMRRMGWDCVVDRAFITIGGKEIQMRHIPKMSEDRYTLHGHVHGKAPFELNGMNLNISCEVINYTPVSEVTILKKIQKYEKDSRQEAPTQVSGNVSYGPRGFKEHMAGYEKSLYAG